MLHSEKKTTYTQATEKHKITRGVNMLRTSAMNRQVRIIPM